MDIEEMRKLLDIDEDNGIEYFEDLAELFETGEDYSCEPVAELLEATDMDEFAGICKEYFKQMEDDIPEDEEELFTLSDNIERGFLALARNVAESRERSGSDEDDLSEDENVHALADEIEKFHRWYSLDENVAKDSGDGYESYVTMSEALFSLRGEKYGADEADYDFSNALDYDLSDYVMDISGSVDLEGMDDDDSGMGEEN